MCFACDPYPIGYDTAPTREIIIALKEHGNHVQILTKAGLLAWRDFDLLDSEDWFGVTISACQQALDALNAEPGAEPIQSRIDSLKTAYAIGIKTWVSCEPSLDTIMVPELIRTGDYIDHFKIGKLNYAKSSINEAQFGLECERLCQVHKRSYYIKEDLRKVMNV